MAEGVTFDSATVHEYISEIDRLTEAGLRLLADESPDFAELDRIHDEKMRAAFRVVGAVKVWLIMGMVNTAASPNV